jgi:hypothetical protein
VLFDLLVLLSACRPNNTTCEHLTWEKTARLAATLLSEAATVAAVLAFTLPAAATAAAAAAASIWPVYSSVAGLSCS